VGAFFLLNACFVSLVLTSSIAKGGWAWSVEDALGLYGTLYHGLFTPVIGGFS
jgi:POT family proton-dependent oligopeptide transporter